MNTHQQLIQAAKERFYREGFRNVGIDAIYGQVGVSKTAFYKHFASKDDLMVAVLREVDAFLRGAFRDMVRQVGGRTARGQIAAVLAVVQQIIEEKNFHGCIFVNAAIEFPLPHDPVHQVALRHKQAIEDFVFALAERAGVLNPEAFAQEFCMVLEGLYITRSVTGQVQAIAVARRLVDCIIQRHVPVERAPAPTSAPSTRSRGPGFARSARDAGKPLPAPARKKLAAKA